MRLGAHDVGHAQPFLVLFVGLDDARHHNAAGGADSPAAGEIHRAIPFGGVVDDDKAFGLVTRLEALSLAGHACPGVCTVDMLPRRSRFRQAASAISAYANRSQGIGTGAFAAATLSASPGCTEMMCRYSNGSSVPPQNSWFSATE